MTSKEFNRRVCSYSSLNFASLLFMNSSFDFIFRVTCALADGSKSVWFVSSLCIPYPCDSIMDCNYLIFDRFSRSDFDIQFKYFKSFYLRCSKFQRAIIDDNSSLSSLVERVKSEL